MPKQNRDIERAFRYALRKAFQIGTSFKRLLVNRGFLLCFKIYFPPLCYIKIFQYRKPFFNTRTLRKKILIEFHVININKCLI